MAKSRYISALAAVLVPALALAQNLDPTVSVTKQYEGKLLEVDKPAIEMAVPDSVTRFDLEFDYSVLQNPYMGTSEFNPYQQLIPVAPYVPYAPSLYVKAGAGYSLHPLFDLVWTPRLKGPVDLNVYAVHRSYFGGYRDIDGKATGFSAYNAFKGSDTYTKGGVTVGYDWNTGAFDFDVNYEGNSARDTLARRVFNSVNATARVHSVRDDDRYFYYDVMLGYSYGRHSLDIMYGTPLESYVGENRIRLDATAGSVLNDRHSALVDVDTDIAIERGMVHTYGGRVSVTPRYVYHSGGLVIDAGIKFEGVLMPQPEYEGDCNYSVRSQIVYPAVNVDYAAIPNYLDVYARIGGGTDINAYSDLTRRNHWFNPMYSEDHLLDYSLQRIRLAVGMQGNIHTHFGYNISLGYANWKNVALDWAKAVSPSVMLPAGSYDGMNMFFAKGGFKFKTQDIDIDANLSYRLTDVYTKGRPGFEPSRFLADLKAVYNWKGKFFAGVSLDAAIARRGSIEISGNPVAARIPGYADLGVSLEYRFNRKFSLWAEGGNLLNMSVQRVPMYAENGINFTAGITFRLM